MSWLYLALLAPLLFAIVNLLDDNLLSFVYKSPYLSTVSAGIYGCLPILGIFFINFHAISIRLALISLIAGIFTLVYYFFYFQGLKVETPSIVVALFSLAPATIPILAHFILHERLNGGEIAGLVIVLIATFSLSIIDVRKMKFSKALIPIFIAIMFMDAESIMTKYAYQRANFYSVYFYFSVGMLIGAVIFLLFKYQENTKEIIKISKRLKKLLPVFIVVELVGLSSELTLNLAISKGPVSLVKAIENIQPMYVLVIALILYPFYPKYFREAQEGNLIKKFSLISLSVAGLLIISISTKI